MAPTYNRTFVDPAAGEQVTVPMTAEEIAQRIKDETAPCNARTTILAREAMSKLMDALPLATQAYLWTTRVAVEDALDRWRPDIAKQIVMDTKVTPEIEETKQQILSLFP